MKVKIKRIDKSLPLPNYQTPGSVACDVYARETVTIPAKQLGKVPGNVIIECPKGYMFAVVSRSSTPSRKGLMVANGIGVGDQDFSGEDDEWNMIFYNFTEVDVLIEKGERIAQILFFPVEKAQWVEVDSMKHNKTRGGIGSTGHK